MADDMITTPSLWEHGCGFSRYNSSPYVVVRLHDVQHGAENKIIHYNYLPFFLGNHLELLKRNFIHLLAIHIYSVCDYHN